MILALLTAAALLTTPTVPNAKAVGVGTCASLNEAISIAEAADPRIVGASADFKQAKAELEQVKSAWNTQFSLFARTGQGDGVLADNQVDNRIGAMLSHKLIDFDAGKLARLSAEASVQSADFSIHRAHKEVALDAAKAYLDVARFAERLDVAKQTDALAQAQAGTVDDRVKQGTLTVLEASQIQTEAARAAADVHQEQLSMDDATVTLQTLTAGKVSCIQSESLTAVETAGPSVNADDTVTSALKQDPELKQADDVIKRAQFDVAAALRENWPSIDFSATYTNDYDAFSRHLRPHRRVGFDFNFPVLRGGRRKADYDSAQARLQKARGERLEVENRIRHRVTSAVTRVIELHEVQKQLVRIASQQHEYAIALHAAYDQQNATTDEVVDADRTALRAQMDAIDAKYSLADAITQVKADVEPSSVFAGNVADSSPANAGN